MSLETGPLYCSSADKDLDKDIGCLRMLGAAMYDK